MTRLHPTQPVILGPGEGKMIPSPEGLTLKVTADETNGSIGVLEGLSEPGFAGPTHIHHTADELFYVLGGEFEFLVDRTRVAATAGSFVFVPRGTIHGPKVVGPDPGKVLIMFYPGGQEHAFEEFAALATDLGGKLDLTEPRALEIVSRYGSEIVGPPI